jgi:hypothetical protein
MLLFSPQDVGVYFSYQKAAREMTAQNGAIEQPR